MPQCILDGQLSVRRSVYRVPDLVGGRVHEFLPSSQVVHASGSGELPGLAQRPKFSAVQMGVVQQQCLQQGLPSSFTPSS